MDLTYESYKILDSIVQRAFKKENKLGTGLVYWLGEGVELGVMRA